MHYCHLPGFTLSRLAEVEADGDVDLRVGVTDPDRDSCILVLILVSRAPMGRLLIRLTFRIVSNIVLS